MNKQEDWDDSTLDSTSSKMKIQNRLEAMTRRERALAYAFSQQVHHLVYNSSADQINTKRINL